MLEAGLLQSIATATPPAPPVPAPAAPPPVSEATAALIGIGFLLILTLGAIAIAWQLRAFAGGVVGGVVGPVRAPGRTPAVLALGAALLAAITLSPLPTILIAVVHGGLTESDLTGSLALVVNLSAFLAAAGGAVLAIALYNRIASDSDRVALGLGPHLLANGLTRGLGWLGVVLPCMLLGAMLLSLLRGLLGYDANATHELLEQMQSGRRESDAVLVGLTIFTAVIVAPLAEEVLFRGIIQTGLGSLFCRVARAGRPPVPEGDAFEVDPSPYVAPDAELIEAPAGPTASHRWAAILITSVGFALLHPAWSIPLILLLAVALGWLYERTGNLWVPITVHLGFNAFNTALALAIA